MAAAVYATMPVSDLVRRELSVLRVEEVTPFLSDQELGMLLARYTDRSATGYTFWLNGTGQWATHIGRYSALTTMSFTGANDHVYLPDPRGVILGYARVALSAGGTITSVGEDSAVNSEFTDSAATYTVNGVVAGDIIVIPAIGATATIVTVSDSTDTLTTTPLSEGRNYAVGQTYYVARSPASDTTDSYVVTARRVDLRSVLLAILDRIIANRSQMEATSIDGYSTGPQTTVESLRQYRSELVGVGYAC